MDGIWKEFVLNVWGNSQWEVKTEAEGARKRRMVASARRLFVCVLGIAAMVTYHVTK